MTGRLIHHRTHPAASAATPRRGTPPWWPAPAPSHPLLGGVVLSLSKGRGGFRPRRYGETHPAASAAPLPRGDGKSVPPKRGWEKTSPPRTGAHMGWWPLFGLIRRGTPLWWPARPLHIPSLEGWPQAGVGSGHAATGKPTPPLARHPSREGMEKNIPFLKTSPPWRGGRRPGWVPGAHRRRYSPRR